MGLALPSAVKGQVKLYHLVSPSTQLQLWWPMSFWISGMTVASLWLGSLPVFAARALWTMRFCTSRRWNVLFYCPPTKYRRPSPWCVCNSLHLILTLRKQFWLFNSTGRGKTLHRSSSSETSSNPGQPAAWHSLLVTCALHHTIRTWTIFPGAGIPHSATRLSFHIPLLCWRMFVAQWFRSQFWGKRQSKLELHLGGRGRRAFSLCAVFFLL